jgi:imidazolonepropionase
MDIHKAGGGINFSVEETKKATEDKLYESLVKRLTNFSKTGKSIYNLSFVMEK